MKVYIVKATRCDYDEFESVVVLADTKERAIEIATDTERELKLYDGRVVNLGAYFHDYQHPLVATEVDLNEEGIIHESFNAG